TEGEQPEGGDAQVLQIVELLGEPAKVPDPVPITVVKRADVQFVDDSILVPQGIVVEHEDVFVMVHAALLVRDEEHTTMLPEHGRCCSTVDLRSSNGQKTHAASRV